MSATRNTAAARLEAVSPAGRRVLAITAFAALTAAGARLAVPLPGTPVPLTFQLVAVLLAGALLGPAAGAASQVAYVTAGAAGLPIFAAGGGLAYLLGPTGGYLLAFPAAAWIAGLGFRRERTTLAGVASLAAAIVVIHAGGLAWLAAMSGPEAALEQSVLPFLAVDVLKLALVLAVARLEGGRLRSLLG